MNVRGCSLDVDDDDESGMKREAREPGCEGLSGVERRKGWTWCDEVSAAWQVGWKKERGSVKK